MVTIQPRRHRFCRVQLAKRRRCNSSPSPGKGEHIIKAFAVVSGLSSSDIVTAISRYSSKLGGHWTPDGRHVVLESPKTEEPGRSNRRSLKRLLLCFVNSAPMSPLGWPSWLIARLISPFALVMSGSSPPCVKRAITIRKRSRLLNASFGPKQSPRWSRALWLGRYPVKPRQTIDGSTRRDEATRKAETLKRKGQSGKRRSVRDYGTTGLPDYWTGVVTRQSAKREEQRAGR